MSLAKIVRRAKLDRELILTPRVHDWLQENGDIVLTPELAERLANMLMSHPRVRSGSFSPSQAGTCPREQVFKFLGAKQRVSLDTVLQNLFNDGTWRHLRWQFMGLHGEWFTDIEVSIPVPSRRATGSIDAVNDLEGWLFELKGTSAGTRALREHVPIAIDYLKRDLVPLATEDWVLKLAYKHLLQIHRYFLQSGGRFDKAILMYESKMSQEFVEFVFEPIPAALETVSKELDMLNSYADEEKLPPMLKMCRAEKGEIFRECPFNHSCSEATWVSAIPKPVKIKRSRDAHSENEDQEVQVATQVPARRRAGRPDRPTSRAGRHARRVARPR